MPKVSVIIPSYNRAQYVCQAIDSALNQTHRDVEVIVVDDGSKDNTREVLKPYIERGQITFLPQNNSGPAAARNTGLRKAKGEYVKFLDSDDFLYLEQLEKQLADIKDEGPDMLSITDCMILRSNGETFPRPVHLVKKERQFASFINGNQGMIHAFLVPRHLVDKVHGFDESLNNCEDLDLWIRILETGAYIKHVAYMGCCCRISDASHSSDLKDMFIQKCKVYDKVNRSLKKEQISSPFLIESLLSTNTQLLEECLIRNMEIEGLLSYTFLMTEHLYEAHKKGIFKALFKALGLKNYLRLHCTLKQLARKDYKSSLMYKDYQWRNV